MNDVLNFTDRNQYQTYMYGIKLLKEDDKFDCTKANLKKFLDSFSIKEAQMGWRNLFTILVGGAARHIPTEWRRLTMENVSVAMALVHAGNTREHHPETACGSHSQGMPRTR